MRRHLATVAVLACLLLAQLHVWADFDTCLWNPAAAQQHRGTSGHGNHGCQTCMTGNLAMVTAVPELAVHLDSYWLETHTPHISGNDLFIRINSPRAPPTNA